MSTSYNHMKESNLDSLQSFLVKRFQAWKPSAPRVIGTSRSHVELCWEQDLNPFGFLQDLLLYRIQKKEKLPPWVTVYSGGKTCKVLENLPPSQPHRFRLQVILRDVGVPLLAYRTAKHLGGDLYVLRAFGDQQSKLGAMGDGDHERRLAGGGPSKRWLESTWSEETWTSTTSAGASAVCFCMAVRCGYLAQVQSMLEERPELVNVVNASSGLTPLATAVIKGDSTMVRALLTAGAEVDQTIGNARTALHLAALHAPDLLALLLEHGASLESKDVNGLRAEHFVADGARAGFLSVLVGAQLDATDCNGWTPLFRAVTQGASSDLISELAQAVQRGSERDRAGLSLRDAALILRDPRGNRRSSLLRIINPQYGRAKDHYHNIRLKVARLHSLVPRGDPSDRKRQPAEPEGSNH